MPSRTEVFFYLHTTAQQEIDTPIVCYRLFSVPTADSIGVEIQIASTFRHDKQGVRVRIAFTVPFCGPLLFLIVRQIESLQCNWLNCVNSNGYGMPIRHTHTAIAIHTETYRPKRCGVYKRDPVSSEFAIAHGYRLMMKKKPAPALWSAGANIYESVWGGATAGYMDKRHQPIGRMK